MSRDPRVAPMPGDVLVLDKFGPTGTEFHVTRVGEGRRGAGSGRVRIEQQVACRLRGLDGVRAEGRGRIYNLGLWPEFMRDARVVRHAEEAPRVK